MNLLRKLLLNKTERMQVEALEYLHKCLKKASYQDGSMKSYFDKGYRSNCYYYSTFLLLCLKPTDKLVRGNIHIKRGYETVDLYKDKKTYPNYKHGWVEFEFKGEWWVYDDHFKYPVKIKEYYKERYPYEINKKFTQKELIEYIKENYLKDLEIETDGKTTKISTGDVWDQKYCLPFYYADLLIKDNKIIKIDIEKRKKIYSC